MRSLTVLMLLALAATASLSPGWLLVAVLVVIDLLAFRWLLGGHEVGELAEEDLFELIPRRHDELIIEGVIDLDTGAMESWVVGADEVQSA